jgi:hypothetical protein
VHYAVLLNVQGESQCFAEALRPINVGDRQHDEFKLQTHGMPSPLTQQVVAVKGADTASINCPRKPIAHLPRAQVNLEHLKCGKGHTVFKRRSFPTAVEGRPAPGWA